jgi:hypothetical protein
MEVLEKNVLTKYGIKDVTVEEARGAIEQNRHNGLSTTYYLALKRWLRQGNKSIADITKYNAEQV